MPIGLYGIYDRVGGNRGWGFKGLAFQMRFTTERSVRFRYDAYDNGRVCTITLRDYSELCMCILVDSFLLYAKTASNECDEALSFVQRAVWTPHKTEDTALEAISNNAFSPRFHRAKSLIVSAVRSCLPG